MSRDLLHEFLETVQRQGAAKGNLRGLLHLLVGRRIAKTDGSPVSDGLTWREVADELKRLRWDPELVKELGLKVDDLPIRDRQRFWFSAIAQAQLDAAEASTAADRLVGAFKKLGYEVTAPPHGKSK